jgi:CBS domain-containing protein
MLVRDLMQRHLVTVANDATLDEAVTELLQTHLSGLPVLDSFGRAVGVISARDILAAARHHALDETLVLEVMQAWPVTVSPEADVQTATDRMLQLGAQRLFVEEGGALVGVISLTDIARAFALAAA